MIYGGIDPGLGGALAFIGEDWIATHDCPLLGRVIDLHRMAGIFQALPLSGVKIGLERAQPMPKEGVISAFHYGEGYGAYKMILAALKIPYEEIHPAKWKRYFGLFKKTKFDSILLAKKMFPKADLSRKKDHGRAEALLIAEYMRRLGPEGESHADIHLREQSLRSSFPKVCDEARPPLASD
jgi:crossover junction endodeoxyribonuclease RuvC